MMTPFSYPDCLTQLSQKVFRRGINYSLDTFRAALVELGNPHNHLPSVIHVAGTNGKGSTVAFLTTALQGLEQRVGTYTSPHITDYCERIAINSIPISETEFARLYHHVSLVSMFDQLTEFEVLTAMSFLHFETEGPDILVIETGLGGRLDATNVVTPIVSVITSIGLDHREILGESLAEIAREKAGIIKPGVPVVSAPQSPEVIDVIEKVAAAQHATLTMANPLNILPDNFQLKGGFQKINAGTAKAVMNILGHTVDNNAFSKAQIWGRYQRFKNGNQIVIVDAAHNPDGIRSLITALEADFPGQKMAFLMGILKRKEVESMLKIVSEKANQTYICDFDPGNSVDSIPLSLRRRGVRGEVLEGANVGQIPELPSDLLVVITGSIYFISRFRPTLAKMMPL